MLGLTHEHRGPLSRLSSDGWHLRDRREPAHVGWVVAGVAVVGLGVLAWAYLGPDLKRYLKIHNM